MRAVILAGGKGTRLRPYTSILPKPLLPVGDRPILEVVLRQLRRAGFREVTLAVGHLAGLIESFFGDGERVGVQLSYFREEQPLGTVGALPLIPDLGRTFLVMNGDVLTNLDYRRLVEYHFEIGATATVATYRREVHIDFGVIEWDGGTRVRDFREKPVQPYYVSMGIYVFEARVLDSIPAGQPFGFDQLMGALMRAGEQVHSFPHHGYWLDLGRPEDYETAVRDYEAMAAQFKEG